MSNHKIGRINWTIAKRAHIKCADIVITDNQLIHIQRRHNAELSLLNISAFDYVKMVVDNYDQIREKRDNAIMLVKTNPMPPHDTCVLELQFNKTKQEWNIKTAQPRNNIEKNRILWNKKKRMRNKNAPLV
ncbi:MAG: hypothetical protein ACI3Z8_04655 [Paludibacteraceae bacterium]